MRRLGCTIWQQSKKLKIIHKNLYFPTLVTFLHTEFPLTLCILPSETLAMMILHLHLFLSILTSSIFEMRMSIFCSSLYKYNYEQISACMVIYFGFVDVAGLGQVQLKLGELKGSVSNFEKVLEVYPDNCETLKVK